MCRWLKSFKVSFASEGKQRAMAKNLIGDNLRAEMGAFTSRREGGGEEIRETPFVCVPNLIAKVSDILSLNDRYDTKEMCNTNTPWSSVPFSAPLPQMWWTGLAWGNSL